MRHPFSLPFLTLALAAFAAPASFAAPHAVASSACPVELTAAQHGLSELVPAGKTFVSPDGKSDMAIVTGPHSAPPQQAFDLSMKNTRLQRIVAAELEVHGTSNKGRVMPARGAVLSSEPTADAVRNVHLASSVPADQSRTHTVSVRDLTSVAWISVIELRYADGSTWHAHPGSECRVVPDSMMLIAGK